MRAVLFGLAVVTAAFTFNVGSANAYPVYPWCAHYMGIGATNCYFSTWEQCRAAASGLGSYCYQNPFYGYAGVPTYRSRPARRYRPY
jgi:Protein of unknown function (DUF3551)